MTDRLMPADWQHSSEFGLSPGSPSTFMRTPAARDLGRADVAIIGLPLDIGCTGRPGARYGPLAIRNASMHLLPHGLREDLLFPPFNRLRVVDFGDIESYPGYLDQSLTNFENALIPVIEAGVFPMCLGGDHSVTLAVLRAAKRKYGPVSLVHFDAHFDTWPSEAERPYHHGTQFRLAIEEGLIDPAASIQIGIRGSKSATLFHLGLAGANGMQFVTADEFARVGVESTVDRIRQVATRPCYVSLDIDCVDPAFAPGTGTPEVAGLSSREIIGMVRGLKGLHLIGFDLVEVAPPYDPAEITALLAANLMYELLLVLADQREGGESG